MRKIFTYVIAATALMVSVSSGASNRPWLFQNVLIEDVIFSSANGNVALSIIMSHSNAVDGQSYNCPATDQYRVVGIVNGSVSGLQKALLSTALSAQAQGTPVDVMVKGGSCHNGSNWGEHASDLPVGLGMELHGIRVRSD